MVRPYTQMLLVVGTAAMLSLLSFDVMAGYARCDNCSESTFKNAARSLGPGTHYLYSLPDRQFRGYDVHLEQEPDVPQPLIPIPTLIPENVLDYFNALADFYVQTAGSLKTNADVQYTSLGLPQTDVTAFNVVNDANLRTMIGDALIHPNIYETVDLIVKSLLESAQKLTGIPDDWQLDINVVFPDGSKVKYKIEGDADNPATYVISSGRTAGGQLIPEELQQGNWLGRPTDALTPLRNHLSALGARMSTMPCSPNERMECAFAGGTLTCRVYMLCN